MARSPSRRRKRTPHLPGEPKLKSGFEVTMMGLFGSEALYESQSFKFIQHHSYRPDSFYLGRYWEFKGGNSRLGWESSRRTAMKLAVQQNPELQNMIVVLKYPESACTKLLTQRQWGLKNNFITIGFQEVPEWIQSLKNGKDLDSLLDLQVRWFVRPGTSTQARDM